MQAPPISRKQFLEQTCRDEEYLRTHAAGVTYARGKHGGFDFQDDHARAVIDGRCEWVNFGPYLGRHQFVIVKPGTTVGWFYAHTSTRPPDGSKVTAGVKVAKISNESAVAIGKHLHLEKLRDWRDWWSCTNPGPELRALQKELRG